MVRMYLFKLNLINSIQIRDLVKYAKNVMRLTNLNFFVNTSLQDKFEIFDLIVFY